MVKAVKERLDPRPQPCIRAAFPVEKHTSTRHIGELDGGAEKSLNATRICGHGIPDLGSASSGPMVTGAGEYARALDVVEAKA
jgi:hypothetical protein